MPAQPEAAWLDGRYIAFSQATVPLEDRGLQFGESLYEVVAFLGGRLHLLDRHAARMRMAASELGIESGLPSDEELEAIVAGLVQRERIEEGILYLQLTGGTAPRSHLPDQPRRPLFFAYLRQYQFPRAADAERGIKAIAMPDSRWQRCDMKTTMLLPAVMARSAAAKAGAGEVIFLGPGEEVREGSASSLLLVEGKTIVVPKQSRHVLPGTTGPVVLDLARQAGLSVRSEMVDLARLRACDELCVASATFLLTPVHSVDGEPIGSGSTGPVIRDLAQRLRKRFGVPEA